MIKEFREFLLRGNLVELAVAFVMGIAFAAVVTSFVDNLVMPIIAMIFGEPNFNDLTFTINDAVFRYGAFLTARRPVRRHRRRRVLLRRQAGERADRAVRHSRWRKACRTRNDATRNCSPLSPGCPASFRKDYPRSGASRRLRLAAIDMAGRSVYLRRPRLAL